MNVKEEYLRKCAAELLRIYHTDHIYVIVTKESENYNAWFDDLVGKEIYITGVDYGAIPRRYLTSDGNSIPFSCAERVK